MWIAFPLGGLGAPRKTLMYFVSAGQSRVCSSESPQYQSIFFGLSILKIAHSPSWSTFDEVEPAMFLPSMRRLAWLQRSPVDLIGRSGAPAFHELGQRPRHAFAQSLISRAAPWQEARVQPPFFQAFSHMATYASAEAKSGFRSTLPW